MAASPDTLLEAETAAPERGHRMRHYQHPERPGEAFCGADVVGVSASKARRRVTQLPRYRLCHATEVAA